MTASQIFIISFGIFNLSLLVFCRQLAPLILKFFSLSRAISPPEKVKEQAAKFGYEGAFSDSATYNPNLKQATRFLAWSGAINFLGCIGIYYLLNTNTIGNTEEQQTIENRSNKDPFPASNQSNETQ